MPSPMGWKNRFHRIIEPGKIMTQRIPERESLTIEFKSDRKRLPDRDLLEAVVCLANSEGGDIYLGVENNGQPTGVHEQHRNLTGVTALIANRTVPSGSVMKSAG